MFDEVNQAIDGYLQKWQTLVSARKNKEFFERLKPTAIGWKTTDLEEYDRLLHEWRGACDHIVEVWMNDRWIAKLHLKDSMLHGDIEIIKIMQRRPNSTDAVGLDHLDFYDSEETNTKVVLGEETDLKWTEEKNGFSVWTSIWFENTEAKLRIGTVIDLCIKELELVNQKVLADKHIPR